MYTLYLIFTVRSSHSLALSPSVCVTVYVCVCIAMSLCAIDPFVVHCMYTFIFVFTHSTETERKKTKDAHTFSICSMLRDNIAEAIVSFHFYSLLITVRNKNQEERERNHGNILK